MAELSELSELHTVGIVYVRVCSTFPSIIFKIDYTYDVNAAILEDEQCLLKRPLFIPDLFVERLLDFCRKEPSGVFKMRSDMGSNFIETKLLYMTFMFESCWKHCRDEQTEELLRAGCALVGADYDKYIEYK